VIAKNTRSSRSDDVNASSRRTRSLFVSARLQVVPVKPCSFLIPTSVQVTRVWFSVFPNVREVGFKGINDTGKVLHD